MTSRKDERWPPTPDETATATLALYQAEEAERKARFVALVGPRAWPFEPPHWHEIEAAIVEQFAILGESKDGRAAARASALASNRRRRERAAQAAAEATITAARCYQTLARGLRMPYELSGRWYLCIQSIGNVDAYLALVDRTCHSNGNDGFPTREAAILAGAAAAWPGDATEDTE